MYGRCCMRASTFPAPACCKISGHELQRSRPRGRSDDRDRSLERGGSCELRRNALAKSWGHEHTCLSCLPDAPHAITVPLCGQLNIPLQ